MKPERWQQIDKVLATSLEREGSERSAFLDEAGADDNCMRNEVASTLAADDQAVNLIEAADV